MSDSERRRLGREVRQRLESLLRAGVDRIPVPKTPRPRPARVEATAAVAPPSEVEVPAAITAPAPRRIEPRPTAAPERPVIATTSLFGETGLEGAALPIAERASALAALATVVAGCTRCTELAETRTQTVFGVGNPSAQLMFIGEAPGADEDRLGEPFVGRAGQLLTDMITKGMGLRREDVYIANILKCRPPGNRDPLPTEAENCVGYLERQIETVRPQFLCLLGRIASQRLLETVLPMGRLRGKWHSYRGVPTMVTYHPAALLRNPAWKKDAWEDLKVLMRAMGLKVPETKKS